MTVIDLVAGILMLVFIITEPLLITSCLDSTRKRKMLVNGEKHYNKSLAKGFIAEGLWKYARHPNFASEQAIWICFYFFGVAASGKWINLTLPGPILLILIFLGSTQLTESISSGKYPAYADYKKNVPKFLPRFFKSGLIN